MPTQDDVRRIALALPGTTEDPGDFVFRANGGHYVWRWLERVDPKKPREPNPRVIAVRVADDLAKRMLLAMDPEVFFTEPHYDGYNAVLVRLPRISLTLLRTVVTEAWQTRAKRSGSRPPRLRQASTARRARRPRPRRA